MTTRQEAIDYCLTYPCAYEDYPFEDANWTVMRRGDTKRGFAWIFEREGQIWLNLKIEPDWGDFFRNAYSAIVPAYHMNKQHWTSVILDGTLPEELIESLIERSYGLCGKKGSGSKRKETLRENPPQK